MTIKTRDGNTDSKQYRKILRERQSSKRTVLIKLGGSLITDKAKPFSPNKAIIRRLSEEIREILSYGDFKLVIGHGGGSFPHTPASKYGTAEGLSDDSGIRGLALVQDAAAQLNRLVVKGLLDAEVNAVSVQPSAALTSEDKKITHWHTTPIEEMLLSGITPVIYGDIGLDSANGCAVISTEEEILYLASKIKTDQVLFCGITDGVYKDRKKREGIITEITPRTIKTFQSQISNSEGIDVTGGMKHKIERSIEIAKLCRQVTILNGTIQGNITKSLYGMDIPCTKIRYE